LVPRIALSGLLQLDDAQVIKIIRIGDLDELLAANAVFAAHLTSFHERMFFEIVVNDCD
jgi:hypothetical protein